MKITKRQLRRIIKEAINETTAGPPIGGEQAISLGGSFDRQFFSDREANPHDGGMYGEERY